jgi:hypothetical protein
MDRLLLVISIIFIFSFNIFGTSVQNNKTVASCSSLEEQDTIPDKQLLLNGRIWRSLYSNIRGDEFLLSKEWLNGGLNINDMTFKNVLLRYDIYNDQLITMINQGTFLQLNKELIKGFILPFENKKYFFENFGNGSGNPIKGFAQVLYKGKICLILKQTKQIKLLAVEKKYDEFYQLQSLYILKDGMFHHISGKKSLFNVLSDKEKQLHDFMKENRIRARKRKPESFIPVLEFYDSLK